MRRPPVALVPGGFVVAAMADAWFLAGEHHGEFWWSDVYGFFSLLGFFGSLAIMLIAKVVVGPWLQRGEDYYHGSNPP
ncbi:MAG TPA: hypothetical protein VFU31_23775 [Candidatus Binatia bacterium]|nr:hypothetical protein [Candidatus Binatia bacterium]